jgi:hypothetical protein
MKKLFIVGVIFALVLQPNFGIPKPVAAQGYPGMVLSSPLAGENQSGSGMPGWRIPDKPIPHHEPGQPARSGSASYTTTRLNETGEPEAVQLTGLDALLADGTLSDPLQGNYTMVGLDKFMYAEYDFDEDPDSSSVSSYAWDGTDLTEMPGSTQDIGNHWITDIAAGDLNRDYVDEQIVAWVNQDLQVEISIRNLAGSVNPITSSPAVIAHPDGTLDMLARGYDYALWRMHSDGGWGSWENEAGGLLYSAPAAAARTPGELDVFAIGADNQVYQAHATPDSFSSWSLVDGGGIWDPSAPMELTPGVPAPAVAADNGMLILFRVAPDQTLRWSYSTDGATWSDWENLGGMLASAPAAVSLQDGRILVAALGMDGALWYRTFTDPATWGAWSHLQTVEGVTQGAVPVLASPEVGQVIVYLAGSENKIWTSTFNSTTWSDWRPITVDGALGSGIGATSGPSGTYLVALLEDGSLVYQLEGPAWAPVPGLPLSPQITLLDGAITQAIPDPTTTLENSILGISTGYFTGDGRQQVIVAYAGADDNLRLEIYDIRDGLKLTKLAELTSLFAGDYPGVAAGDVDGDGVDEVGLVYSPDAYNCYLKVFKLVVATSPPPPYDLIQLAEDHWWIYWDQFFYFAGSLRIAAGDVVPEASPNDEFVVLSDWYGVGDIVLPELRVYDNDPDFHLFDSFWYAYDMPSQDPNYPSIFYTGFDVAIGNVDGSGLDEIVYTWPSAWDEPYPHLERSLWILRCNETECTEKTHTNVPDKSAMTFLDRVEVADLDQDLKDEIVLARTSGEIGNFHVALEVYAYDTSLVKLYGYVIWYESIPRSSNLATGDFTGEKIRLGPPTYRMQQKMTSPEMFLNMPPKHRDIVPDGYGEMTEIVINQDATSTYTTTNDQTIESSSQSNREWSLSVGMESSVGGAAGTVEASLDYTYGSNFSKTETAINSITFSSETTAQYYDQVVFNATNYGIWEYPILGVETTDPEQLPTLVVVFPLVNTTTMPTNQQGRVCDENFYTPSHQPNNVWSYDSIGDNIYFKDYLDVSRLVGSAQTSGDRTITVSMESVAEILRSDSFRNQISAGLEYSYENELEIPLVGKAWDFSFRAHANGEYDYEELSTLKSSFTKNTQVVIDVPGEEDPSSFNLIAFLYWAKGGYLVLDYQTQPTDSGSWTLYDEPDPAFILPWYGFPDPSSGLFPSPPDPDAPPCGLAKQHFTHDIDVEPQYAKNGESVTLKATVRNFSNHSPDADVMVRFYLGYPGTGNQVASCTIEKEQLVRINGPASCDTEWLVSGASGEEKIYAVIDPLDAIEEMHDASDIINNNIGYGLLYAANADYFDPGLSQVQAYQTILYEESPGSVYGLYVPTTNSDITVRYEVIPTDVGPLTIVGVPIQVQAFLGGVQEPDKYHEFGPTPAGLMITYTDTDLLPGMDENNLRLYRLDGTTWVDATCPGYNFVRFTADNAVAVPVCQVGTFVLSDQEPVLPQMGTFLPLIVK